VISAARVKTLTYYFEHDHFARGRSYFISVIVGTLSLLIFDTFHFPEQLSVLLTLGCIVLAYTSFLIQYRPKSVTAGKTAALRSLKERTKSVTEGKRAASSGLKEKGETPMLLPNRRRLIFQSIIVSVAALVLAFVPKRGMADIVNARIRKLISKGLDEEAKSVAHDAIDAGIPLRSDVTKVIATAEPNALTSGEIQGPTRNFPVRVDLEGQPTIDLVIQQKILHVPQGSYQLHLPISLDGVSIVGDGAYVSELVSHLKGIDGDSSLLEYDQDRPLDVLIESIGIFHISGPSPQTGAISVAPAKGKVAVSNAAIRGMLQRLDRVIWSNTAFVYCTIVLDGDWFDLYSVPFMHCDFVIASSVPDAVRNMFQKDDLSSKTLRYRPSDAGKGQQQKGAL
jgi:hypothetical protein